MMKPLEGLKIVELARVLAGPWAGQILADLGADVIKIEHPDGDETRHWGPPFHAVDGQPISAYFLSCNRGKKSVTADFNNKQDLQYVRDIISDADIVIENFKVGSLQKFGLDYASLAASYPHLIYCSISGFGQNGPYKNKAGYDYLVQAMGGLMHITGEAEGQPQKIGVAMADISTGLYATIGILAALIDRHKTGQGQHIDNALLDTTCAILANQALNYLVSGSSPKRMGNNHPNIVPYSVFPTADGYVVIAVGNDGQFKRLCQLLSITELQHNNIAHDNASRVANRDAVNAIITRYVISYNTVALLTLLDTVNIPASSINDIENVFNNPQVQARNMQVRYDGVPGVRTPINFSRSKLSYDIRPPLLGEHNYFKNLSK